MRKPLAFAIVLLFVAATPFLWVNPSRGADLDQGKNLYSQKCAICHGHNGAGDGPAAASLTPQPSNFTKAGFWHRKNIDQIISTTILKGHGPMPPFHMNATQLKALIDYMKHSFKPAG